MKNWIDFVKIKFHLNEDIEWHCMQFDLNLDFNELHSNLLNSIQFNFNTIKLNVTIGLKFTWFEFKDENIESFSKIVVVTNIIFQL
jgi:hypothetical protein